MGKNETNYKSLDCEEIMETVEKYFCLPSKTSLQEIKSIFGHLNYGHLVRKMSQVFDILIVDSKNFQFRTLVVNQNKFHLKVLKKLMKEIVAMWTIFWPEGGFFSKVLEHVNLWNKWNLSHMFFLHDLRKLILSCRCAQYQSSCCQIRRNSAWSNKFAVACSRISHRFWKF